MPAVMRDGPKAPRGKGGAAPAKRARGSAPAPEAGRLPIPPRIALIATGAVLIGGLGLVLATGGRAHALQTGVDNAVAGQLARAGLRVANVEVEGASRFSVPYIVQAAAVQHGAPLMGLDLREIRERVQQVGWVKSVRILRLMPDTVVLAVSERPRLAVWQSQGQSHVVDPDGQVIPEADPGLFVDLPLIVGDGAPQAAGAVLPLVQTRPRLMGKLEALVRVDGRRWDLRLKDGSLIQLPAVGEDAALIQLDQLDQKNRLLDLGFERIDLRDPEMVVVRPRQPSGPQTASAANPAPTPAKT
ncbi:MAG: cell division protein FtsQ/DivIB [Caulobacteraceae bacterium]